MKKERAKRSPIWLMSAEKFKAVIENSATVREALEHFGMQNKGGNYKTLKKRMNTEKLVFGKKFIRTVRKSEKPDSEVFVQDSNYSRTALKKRFLNIVDDPNHCSICKLSNKWNGESLTFILDHINGISNDNRIENLRLVCPNCNSQLETHCGKHKRRLPVPSCLKCEKPLSDRRNKTNLCRSCQPKPIPPTERHYVIDWPETGALIDMVENSNYSAVGRSLGVSDNAVRKRIKNHSRVV